MKSSNALKPRRRASRAANCCRLEWLIKQVLAGKISIYEAAAMTGGQPAMPYRRVVE